MDLNRRVDTMTLVVVGILAVEAAAITGLMMYIWGFLDD